MYEGTACSLKGCVGWGAGWLDCSGSGVIYIYSGARGEIAVPRWMSDETSTAQPKVGEANSSSSSSTGESGLLAWYSRACNVHTVRV